MLVHFSGEAGYSFLQIILTSHLRYSKLLDCFARFRQGRRIIRDHFSVVFLCISQMTFLKLCPKITHWDLTLNEMVRDKCVNYILSSPFWHVAGNAVSRIRVLASGNQGANDGFMTMTALSGIVACGFLASGKLAMWIMAGQACRRPLARPEATRFPKSICNTHEFKFVIVSAVRCMIEVQDIVLKGLPGDVGKYLAIKSSH